MSLFCNGEHVRTWLSENCEACARFNFHAKDCGCDLSYAIHLAAGTGEEPESLVRRLGFAGEASYINHQCPEFISKAASV